MDYEKEITELKSKIELLQAQVYILKMASSRANQWVDELQKVALDQAGNVSDIHKKIDTLFEVSNPKMMSTFSQLEKILGDPACPTPDAPPHS